MFSFRLDFMRLVAPFFLALGLCLLNAQSGHTAEMVIPLNHAHAHNDYWHARPLLDSLSLSFMSVEADVILTNGELLVGHERKELSPEKTLDALYLKPLYERFKANKGTIYNAGQTQPFMLLVDFKKRNKGTYQKLKEDLEPYRDMLTRYEDGKMIEGAVIVLVCGYSPRVTMQAETSRLVFYDSRYAEKNYNFKSTFSPLRSDNWNNFFTWFGAGEMPDNERKMLKAYLDRAHKAGRKVRFWHTPEYPSIGRERLWGTLLDMGVDYINTDDIQGLHDFLIRRESGEK